MTTEQQVINFKKCAKWTFLYATGCHTRLDKQHCPLRTYIALFVFKGRETLWGHNTAFIFEYERVKPLCMESPENFGNVFRHVKFQVGQEGHNVLLPWPFCPVTSSQGDGILCKVLLQCALFILFFLWQVVDLIIFLSVGGLKPIPTTRQRRQTDFITYSCSLVNTKFSGQSLFIL